MPPKKTNRPLRQATLLNRRQFSKKPGSSSQKPVSHSKRSAAPRQRVPDLQLSDDDSDDEGLGGIRLEPKKPNAKSMDESDQEISRQKRTNTNIPARRQRIRKRQHSASEEEEKPSPRRRKLVKGKRQAVESSSEDAVDKDRIITNRFRTRKMSAFQKNLERLKRRKQGLPTESSSNGEDGSDTDETELFAGAKPTSDYDSLFDEDSDASHTSDFIVEDDNAVPTTLPIQFSMETHGDLNHQFKKIFQFFVHMAVRPAKERHEFMKEQFRKEEYFAVPLQVTRRKLSSMRDSLVASSVWRPDFKNSLEKYPEFDLVPLDFAVPACDACHLGGRMSTLIGRLSGLPYDRWGFEIINDLLDNDGCVSDDDSSDGDSTDSDSSDGSEIKPATADTIEFNLGRFCARRTRVYHEFTHWEYNLFKSVRDEVDDLHASNQSGGFFRIAYAGGKKPPEDLDDADAICDWLDERKVIDMQWEKLKLMMESAQHLELASKADDQE